MKDRDARTSRRVFLQTALAAGAVGATAASERTTARPEPTGTDQEQRERRQRLEQLLKEYGSEIGELRRVVGES
jgi:hypothetical protein